MKILLVVAYFIPEVGSASHVYHDLARGFVQNGHEVHVITSYPRDYNLSEEDRNKTFPLSETMDGINVHRVRHDSMRDNILLRGMEHFIIPGQYFKEYKRLGIVFDACIMYIPPLPLYKLALRIRRRDGTPTILNFQDFHPQELVDIGVMRNPLIIKYFERMERRSYRKADYITVLSPPGIEYVKTRGGNGNVAHIYNSVDLSEIGKHDGRKDFKIAEGIEGKLLISYAGILSPFQGLDSILDAAKVLEEQRELIFYIVGDGMKRSDLQARIEKEGISNVRMLGMQPRKEYFNIVNSSDISLVALDSRMNAPCLPGKILNLMSMRQAIVAVVPKDSATADLMNSQECGMVAEPGNRESIARAIRELAADPARRRKMGERGRLFVEKEMNLSTNVMKYEGIIAELRKKV